MFVEGDKFLAGLFEGEGFWVAGLAKITDGAEEAGWLSWGAEGLAEFHEGGVEAAGGLLIEEVAGSGPDGFLTGSGIDCCVLVEES